ncbi:MAG TPA: AMP-binding protein [Terriglobia bacterium]|nr:AMP-binding protein [Terriglobia bacterium]
MFNRIFRAADYWSTRNIPRMTKLAPVVPSAILRARARAAFRDLMIWTASRSDYYRKRFAEAHIDPAWVGKIEHLGDFYTWPEDVQDDPLQFLCRAPGLVCETSGTTGRPKRTYFSYEEIDWLARYEACALYYCGIRSGDRVLCTFDQGFWVTGPMTEATLRHLNVFGSVVGKVPADEAYRRMQDDRYTVLLADPTWLLTLTDVASSAGNIPKLKFIMCGGDRLPERTRTYAQDVWRCPVLQGYGTTETCGFIGGECLERNGLHLDEFNLIVEIVDRDSEGFGEIVVTTLSRRVMPLIRYRTRDVARLVEGPCRCGSTIQRISPLKARRDDMVVMGAGNIYPVLLEKLVEPVAGWPKVWQAAVLQREGRDVLEFRILKNGDLHLDELRKSIEEQIRIQQPGMWTNLQCAMYCIDVREVMPTQSKQPRKVSWLVDER